MKSKAIIAGALILGAVLIPGIECARKANRSQQQSQLEIKTNLPEPTPNKAPEKEDYSTPITKVSLSPVDSSDRVAIRTNYTKKINPVDLDAYGSCKVSAQSNDVALVMFGKELLEFDSWGGAVYAPNCDYYTHRPPARCKSILGDSKFFGIRMFVEGMDRIRIEAQDKDEALGTTFKDEIRLYTNAVNDILVDLSKLATNSSGSMLDHICQLKLIAEPRYMTADHGMLVIYDMGLK